MSRITTSKSALKKIDVLTLEKCDPCDHWMDCPTCATMDMMAKMNAVINSNEGMPEDI